MQRRQQGECAGRKRGHHRPAISMPKENRVAGFACPASPVNITMRQRGDMEQRRGETGPRKRHYRGIQSWGTAMR